MITHIQNEINTTIRTTIASITDEITKHITNKVHNHILHTSSKETTQAISQQSDSFMAKRLQETENTLHTALANLIEETQKFKGGIENINKHMVDSVASTTDIRTNIDLIIDIALPDIKSTILNESFEKGSPASEASNIDDTEHDPGPTPRQGESNVVWIRGEPHIFKNTQ